MKYLIATAIFNYFNQNRRKRHADIDHSDSESEFDESECDDSDFADSSDAEDSSDEESNDEGNDLCLILPWGILKGLKRVKMNEFIHCLLNRLKMECNFLHLSTSCLYIHRRYLDAP